jgi:hypothetical protein
MPQEEVHKLKELINQFNFNKRCYSVEDLLPGMSGTQPVPDLRYFRSLDILAPKEHSDRKKTF